jgi:hypothetical protein
MAAKEVAEAFSNILLLVNPVNHESNNTPSNLESGNKKNSFPNKQQH